MHQLEKEGGKIEEKWPTESGQLLNKQSVALMKEAALWLAWLLRGRSLSLLIGTEVT